MAEDIRIHTIPGFANVELTGGKYLTVHVTDSVAVLVYNSDSNKIMLVNQPRPALQTEANPEGYVTELVAGRCDYTALPKQIMADELEQEAGITIDADQIILINQAPMALCAGLTNEHVYLGFAQIDNSMMEAEEKVRGVDEGERVTRVWIDVREFVEDYQPGDVRVMLMKYWLKDFRWQSQVKKCG